MQRKTCASINNKNFGATQIFYFFLIEINMVRIHSLVSCYSFRNTNFHSPFVLPENCSSHFFFCVCFSYNAQSPAYILSVPICELTKLDF